MLSYYFVTMCNLNGKNYFRQILNHVEMMLITNFERILIITTEVVNVEAQSKQNMELVQIWHLRCETDRKRNRQGDTEEIQTSHLILNMQGLDGRYLLKNES